ncbi:MAG: SRPBCC family protein [Mucilaginibacter sp.]
MTILIIILLIIAAIITLLLIIAFFMKREHYIKREIIINAPRQKVFDYIKLLKNQDTFNSGAMADADREREFKGTDGTVGYIYAWSGNKDAGEGEKEIMNIVEGEKIEMEIRFVKPITTSARIIMETESLSDDQTKVIWSNAGTLKYPINLMIPMMEKHVVKDMDGSLSTLKNILEK